jgi:hypothetical protein
MLTEILSGLFGLSNQLIDSSIKNRDSRDEALRAISTALTETYSYYHHLEKNGQRNEDTENKLSTYWSAAAIFIRHYDRDLAMRCEFKSEFWREYGNWSRDKIERTGIQLDCIKKLYRDLLFPGRSKSLYSLLGERNQAVKPLIRDIKPTKSKKSKRSTRH